MTSTASKKLAGAEQLIIIVTAMIATTFIALLEAGQFSDPSPSLYWASMIFSAILPIQTVAWGEACGRSVTTTLFVCFWIGGLGLWLGLALIALHFSGYHASAYLISSVVGAALILRRIKQDAA